MRNKIILLLVYWVCLYILIQFHIVWIGYEHCWQPGVESFLWIIFSENKNTRGNILDVAIDNSASVMGVRSIYNKLNPLIPNKLCFCDNRKINTWRYARLIMVCFLVYCMYLKLLVCTRTCRFTYCWPV